jgi:spore maturation protein CgeB
LGDVTAKSLSKGALNKALDKADEILRKLDEQLRPRPLETLIEEEIEKHLRPGAPLILYVTLRYDYGDETRGLSFEHHNLFETLINMEFSVIYFDYDRLRKKYGERKMGDMLRETARYYNPAYIFYAHYHDWVPHDVWHDIGAELPGKTIIWLSDDHWRYEETRPVWKKFDLVTTTDRNGLEKRGNEGFQGVHLTQWACNHYVYHNFRMPRDIDVSFIGQPYGDRREFIAFLCSQGIKVVTFGKGWEGGGRVSQGEMISILNRSRIVLDLSKASKGADLQIKGRVFEATGAGALLVTQTTPHLEDYFEIGKEIVVYEDRSDCVEKIKALLADEPRRKEMAEAGYRRVMSEHTFEHRVRGILAAADAVGKRER